MTTTRPIAAAPTTTGSITAAGASTIRAGRAGFGRDVVSVAGRALRSLPREPEAIIPALIVPLFFFVVNIGSLQELGERAIPGLDVKAFQLPVAIVFAVTGLSRANALVTDIQDGYFDRLLLTPIARPALLLGLMVADFALVCAITLPVIALGLIVGVSFGTGFLGAVAFVLLAGSWGLAFTGFPYAIALKTGNPAAVNSSFILFFPFAFLTTAFLPREALTSWLDAVAGYNPVTYLLDGLRSLLSEDWDWSALGKALGAVLAVASLSMSMCFLALRGRLARG